MPARKTTAKSKAPAKDPLDVLVDAEQAAVADYIAASEEPVDEAPVPIVVDEPVPVVIEPDVPVEVPADLPAEDPEVPAEVPAEDPTPVVVDADPVEVDVEADDVLIAAQLEAAAAAVREAVQKDAVAEAAASLVVLDVPEEEPSSNFEAVTAPDGSLLHFRRVSPKTRPYL